MIKYNFYIGLLVWGALSLSSCAHEDIINDISENNPQNKENNPDKSNDNDLPDLYTLKQNDSFIVSSIEYSIYNPYKDHPNKQYKGQLHCHTYKSDGALTPIAVMQKYIGYGYDFMTITDHNILTPCPDKEADIVWLGESYEDTRNSAGHQHMNVLNCNEVIGRISIFNSSNTPETLVEHFVKNGNAILSYNHPEDRIVYASDETLRNLPDGILFVEIYNATIHTNLGDLPTIADLPKSANYGDMYIVKEGNKRFVNTSSIKTRPKWTETTEKDYPNGNLDRGFRIMLDTGKKVFCSAVDDFHRGDNMENRGWMMVFAKERTKEAIWNGLITGSSYASNGVYLNDISFINGIMELDIKAGDGATTTFYGKGNEVLSVQKGSFPQYKAQGNETYIRAMVELDGKKAWSQPIWIIAKKSIK